MTNDLDNLLEQVEDVLEEDGSALWQPDLTVLVLPQAREDRAKADPQDSQAGAYAGPSDALANFSALENQQTLPRFQRAGEDNSQTPGSSGSNPQDLSKNIAVQLSSPALLEQLRTLEDIQAGAEALGRSQENGGSLTSRAFSGQGGSGLQYDPAALRDSPLAAAAAAAQQQEDARAVDRAFQRDSRRYDRGFSLY